MKVNENYRKNIVTRNQCQSSDCNGNLKVNLWVKCKKKSLSLHLLFFLSYWRHYYPDPHPVHGVQLMRVGKLQHFLEHIEEALDTFKQVWGMKCQKLELNCYSKGILYLYCKSHSICFPQHSYCLYFTTTFTFKWSYLCLYSRPIKS